MSNHRLRNRLRRRFAAFVDSATRLFASAKPAGVQAGAQRICSSCGLITPRSQRICLECGSAQVRGS